MVGTFFQDRVVQVDEVFGLQSFAQLRVAPVDRFPAGGLQLGQAAREGARLFQGGQALQGLGGDSEVAGGLGGEV